MKRELPHSTLSDVGRREFHACAQELAAAAASGRAAPLAALVAAAARDLARRLPEWAATVKPLVPAPAWRLGGLLTDERWIGPTPTSWKSNVLQVPTREEIVLLLVGQLLGEIFCWATQQGGAAVHDIVPLRGQENSLLSSSSRKALSLHTEDAFFAERADLLILHCLRNPDRVPTWVSDVEDLDLPPEHARVARQPRFLFLPDGSHHNAAPGGDSGGFRVIHPKLGRALELSPLIEGDARSPRLRLDIDYMEAPGDDEAARTVVAVDQALHRCRRDVVLGSGDLLVIDNRRCVHGRANFEPRYDGRDRWLKRINIYLRET